MTQKEMVLDYLETHPEGLTPLMALEQFGCMRLASTVCKLKADGHDIQSRLVRTSTGKRVAVYTLGGAA